MRAWLYRSPHAQGKRDALFKELAPLLRYHHMTSDFLAHVVCKCPLMKQSGLLLSVLESALVQREAPPAVLQKLGVVRGRANRGVDPANASWEVKAVFTLEQIAAMEPCGIIVKWCGLVAGYSAAVEVERDVGDTLGVYLRVEMPPSSAQLQGALPAGICLKMD